MVLQLLINDLSNCCLINMFS